MFFPVEDYIHLNVLLDAENVTEISLRHPHFLLAACSAGKVVSLNFKFYHLLILQKASTYVANTQRGKIKVYSTSFLIPHLILPI